MTKQPDHRWKQSGLRDIAYSEIKALLKQGDCASVRHIFESEVKRVDEAYSNHERRCMADFQAHEQHRRQHGHYPSSLPNLIGRVLTLIKHSQWNYVAVNKLVHRAHRYGYYSAIPQSALRAS
eukprot:TRINITY_DN12096_c0_g2_i4.p1 TRINITY_DN12096_c0_g2~~TRINITY_DN12096_c0_g2_i4.p1  ORF type:complete len:123 (+),score=3.59 TRINITY_DN12096_c0_g2_i4:461-829(+)